MSIERKVILGLVIFIFSVAVFIFGAYAGANWLEEDAIKSLSNVMSTISFLVGVTSFVLAIVAMWITNEASKQATTINNETRHLLSDIQGKVEILTSITIPELKAYGDNSREVVTKTMQMLPLVNDISSIISEAQKAQEEAVKKKQES